MSTIGSGGDFSTVAAWWASLASTLTSPALGEVLNEELVAQTTLSGVTTDATNNVTLTTDGGASFRDHVDADTNSLTYNASNGAALRASGGYQSALIINIADFTIRYLQVSSSHPNGTSAVNMSGAPSGSGLFDSCIIESGASNVSRYVMRLRGSNATIVNSLISKTRNSSAGDFLRCDGGGQPQVLACTLVDETDSGDAVLRNSYSDTFIKGCAFFGMTQMREPVGGSPDVDVENSVTDLADANNSGGIDSNNLVSRTYSSQFESSAAPFDFRAVVGSDLEGHASPLTETNDEDIIGQARDATNPWAGCWEVPAAAGVGSAWPSPIKQMTHLLNR